MNKKKKKIIRFLEGVTFDHEGAHIALTSQGAASLKDEPYLLKQLSNDTEFTPLEKNLAVDNNTPSSASVDLGEDNKNQKGKQEIMSENSEILDKNKELEKEIKILKAEKTLVSYEFAEDIQTGVAAAIANLEESDAVAITKAFDALLAIKDEAINKAKELETKEQNPIAKALDEEVGNDSSVEQEVELTMAEKIIKSRDEIQKGAK